MTIPIRRLESGALLLFTFFMISDPRTTPDSRAGRVLFGALVASVAWYVQFRLFRTNGVIWSLAVLLAARALPRSRCCPAAGTRGPPSRPAALRRDKPRSRLRRFGAVALAKPHRQPATRKRSDSAPVLVVGARRVRCLAPRRPADAFCGFYVSKADTKLFNKASKVVIVRDGDRTVLTMSNDFKGEPKEFAVVVPVPTFLQREQIHVGEQALVDHLDAFTAPRLVEYFDEDPCDRRRLPARWRWPAAMDAASPAPQDARAKALGVTIEAHVHRRRVRHPDPVGQGERRARDVAARRTATACRRRAAPVLAQLPRAEHALLRRAR